jgi:hypothetical protein
MELSQVMSQLKPSVHFSTLVHLNDVKPWHSVHWFCLISISPSSDMHIACFTEEGQGQLQKLSLKKMDHQR